MGNTSLERLFRPRSVAIIGASSDPRKVSGRPLHFLKKHGFPGEIWPVNPNADEIEGYRCYPDIAGLPGVPDTAIILVGPAHAESAVGALADLGTGAAIVLTGGYAEIGDHGIRRQKELIDAAGNMRLLGPNTIGLLNMTDGITLSASGALDVEDRLRGSVAVVSQSGGVLGSLLSRAAGQGVGLSHLAATGNEADIDVSDIMSFLGGDDATRVIALYLETIREPDRFRAAAAEIAGAGKRLVVYKVGRSEAGARSAASHTGALAGEDRVFDALFRQVGAIRVNRYSDLIDVPMGLANTPPLSGNRIAIVTHTGGAAGLVADVCGVAGFETPDPGADTAARLGAVLQDEGFVPGRNPVDLTLAGLDPEVTYQAILALAESPDFDAVIPIVGSSSVGRPHLVADPVIRAMETVDKPLIVYTSPAAPEIVRRLNGRGVPTFDAPEACASVLTALRTAQPSAIGKEPGERVESVRAVPKNIGRTEGALNELEAKQLFAAYSIPTVREIAATDPADAARIGNDLGDRVVVKILSRNLMHKTEIGGVRTNVPAGEVQDACERISRDAHIAGIEKFEGFLIQEQIHGADELILGFRRDPVLGPAILLGAGGTLTEVYDDAMVGLLPVSDKVIRSMIDGLKISRVLNGHRGSEPADIDLLSGTVRNFAYFCMDLDDILVEAEINPLFVCPGEGNIKAADAVVIFGV